MPESNTEPSKIIYAFAARPVRSQTFRLPPRRVAQMRFAYPAARGNEHEPTLEQRINWAKETIANCQDIIRLGVRPVKQAVLEKRIAEAETLLEKLLQTKAEQRVQSELLPPPAEERRAS